MSYFLEVPIGGDEVVLVEVTNQVDDLVPAGRADNIIGKLPEAFESAMDRVQSLAVTALAKIRRYPEPPDTVTVEFGLKFTAKAGLVVAESTGEAHIKLIVEWRRPDNAQPKREDDNNRDETSDNKE